MSFKEDVINLAEEELWIADTDDCICSESEYRDALAQILKRISHEGYGVECNLEHVGTVEHPIYFKNKFILPENTIKVIISKNTPLCSWDISRKMFCCDEDTAKVNCCLFDESKEYSKDFKIAVATQIVIKKLENKFQNTIDFYEERMHEVLSGI